MKTLFWVVKNILNTWKKNHDTVIQKKAIYFSV